MKRAWIILLTVWLAGHASAQVSDTLERIEAERRQVQADSQNAEAQCYERFAVNACLSDVSASRRTRLAQLKKRELAVRDAQRAERTREQLQLLEEKQQDQAERVRELANRAPEPVPQPKLPPQPAGPASPPADKAATVISPADAAANRAAYDAKVLEAARYKAEVEKRLSEQKERADPLPISP
ncbi:hypothetical protein [Rhodoferax bucti]|uniref:hypothetical protein n=1 Tax=Rhodoferax bucti TaxID=2576305 RepID=UPI001108DF97|nr:hypothetical protein [Rhodoferax bucti]